MFDTLIAALLAYFQAHPEEVPLREVFGRYAVFARSVQFWYWALTTPPWERPPHFRALEEQIALLGSAEAPAATQFEIAMAAAFPRLC